MKKRKKRLNEHGTKNMKIEKKEPSRGEHRNLAPS